MSTAIQVENISKQYNLGTVGTGTLSHDLNRWWAIARGKEDPYLTLGESNDRTKKGSSDLVWALKDVSFDVQQGDALGIIGRNGAGKSTLLKILSRTTTPTQGCFKVKGRIASLLEVGTGFHPELTGRENIYLNGAILGMTKAEIKSKFDEIVDFSGVERYIETPVKRYSSGMYVRLAFAVAAHLEPEILIVDEVLAVGDTEFQKKCIGKMKDVNGAGRTVLFVSHNMAAIKQLCNKGIILNNGTVAGKGSIDEIIHQYQLLNDSKKTGLDNFESRKGSGECRITDVTFQSENGLIKSEFHLGEKLNIDIALKNLSGHDLQNLRIIIGIYNSNFEGYLRFDSKSTNSLITLGSENSTVVCKVMEHLNIRPDQYSVNIEIHKQDKLIDQVQGAATFTVTNFDYFETGKNIDNDELTKVFYKHHWEVIGK